MKRFEQILMKDLEELNSSEFNAKLKHRPVIVSISRLEKDSAYNWCVVLSK
jgi:hypothetical protein